MGREHSPVALDLEWSALRSNEKKLLKNTLVDMLIVCSACGAFAPLLGLGQWGKPLFFALAAACVGYQLVSNPTTCRNIFLLLRDDLLFWSAPIVVVIWTFISALWSPLPLYTLASAAALTVTAVTGLYFGSKYKSIELISLLAASLTFTMFASLIACLLFPEVAIMHHPEYDQLHDGRWRGVYSHKNWLGLMAGLSAILLTGVFQLHSHRSTTITVTTIISMIVTMLLLHKSESTTALIALSTCAVYLGYQIFRGAIKKNKLSYCVIAILLLPALYTVTSELNYRISTTTTDSSTYGFTRDSSLSGRVPHWHNILHETHQRPLTGFGYSAFWRSDYSSPIDEKNQWIAFQAHSGWLEAILDFGLPVAVLAIGWMLFAAASVFKRSLTGADYESTIVFTMMLFLLIANSTESQLLNSSGLLTIIYMALCTYKPNRSCNRNHGLPITSH